MIRDRTYFVVEAGGEMVGCGGWSPWRTLFGADAGRGDGDMHRALETLVMDNG